MQQLDEFEVELEQFWTNYAIVDPGFSFFASHSRSCWRRAIPVAIHGDEGRGKAKNPIMVVSLQVVLPVKGTLSNMQTCQGSCKERGVLSANQNIFDEFLSKDYAVY